MTTIGFDKLLSEVASIKSAYSIGQISEVSKGVALVKGLNKIAAIGDLVEIHSADAVRKGEVLQLNSDHITILPDGGADGLSLGDTVSHIGAGTIAPDDTWIGKTLNPFGEPLDGSTVFRGSSDRVLRSSAANPTERRSLGDRLETGLAVFNTLLPIVKGQRIGLFAGSGVGKSTLLAKLASGIQTDIVVIAMIGERGREVREFVDRVLGPNGMKRSVVIAATSDQSAMTRRRCAWAAMTVAEHFRDQGKQVLLLADSITRFAEAHREVALAIGEESSLRGFPPSTSAQITSLCERAGPGSQGQGDITAVFSVLVAGSDMNEPIADILRGVLDGHVVLDRKIAERGRFPAIDLLRSVSRALPHAASEKENELIAKARKLLGIYDRAELMIQAGLYTKGSDPKIDEASECWPKLEEFFTKSETKNTNRSFEELKNCFEVRSATGEKS